MDAMKNVLERLKGRSSQAELVEIRSRQSSVNVSNNRIKGAKSTENLGYALRVVVDGRLGFATASSVENPDAIIEYALETAPFGEKVDFEFSGPGSASVQGIYDEKLAGMTLNHQADFIATLCDRVKAAWPKGVTEGRMTADVNSVRVVTSHGQDAGYERTRCEYEVSSQLALEGDLRFGGDGYAGVGLRDESERFVNRIVQQMTLSETVAKLKSGPTDVLFIPNAAVELFWPLMEALNGDNVLRKTSPFAGKIGEQLFAPGLNLFDDGTLEGSPRSGAIDDEGTPTGRRAIIENGVLKGYLLDRRSAAGLGMAPTGNGLKLKMLSADKNLEGMPVGVPTNWVVPAGTRTTEELIASMDEGLLLMFLGGTHSANHLAGQVAGNVYLGFKIEGGRLVGRVKNTMLSLNAHEAFKNQFEAVSSDTEFLSHIFVPAGFVLPSILLSGVDIAAGS